MNQKALPFALAASFLLAACGDDGGRGSTDAQQTKFPGQVSSGGATSGEVMARNKLPVQATPNAGGTPAIPQGAGGTPGGAATAGTTPATTEAKPGATAANPGAEAKPGATAANPGAEAKPGAEAGAQGQGAPAVGAAADPQKR